MTEVDTSLEDIEEVVDSFEDCQENLAVVQLVNVIGQEIEPNHSLHFWVRNQ